jgi:hypothetical protein
MTDIKATRNIAKQFTKDFTKLVKTFVKTSAKGGHSNLAFVVGYLDAVSGKASDWNGIPEKNLLDYSKGWQSGAGKEPKKRKSKRARL